MNDIRYDYFLHLFTTVEHKISHVRREDEGLLSCCGVVEPAGRHLSSGPVGRARRNETQLCSDGLARELETVQRPSVLEELHRSESGHTHC